MSESQSLNNNLFSTENHLIYYQWVYPLTLNPINPRVTDLFADPQWISKLGLRFASFTSSSRPYQFWIHSWWHILSLFKISHLFKFIKTQQKLSDQHMDRSKNICLYWNSYCLWTLNMSSSSEDISAMSVKKPLSISEGWY